MNSVQNFFPILDPAPSSKPGRKDGSAMFSLGSLIQRQTSAPPPAPSADAPVPRSQRSGLIDLSDLRDRPDVVGGHLGVFPLGAPPSKRPAAVGAAVARAPARARRPLGAIVAAAVIAAAGIGAAVGIVRTAEARGPAAMSGVADMARALPGRMPAEPRVEATTPAPVDPGVTPPVPTPPAPTVAAVTPRPTVTARPAVTARPPKPPAPTPVKSPSDPCRGDLMCAMQQAVNKKK